MSTKRRFLAALIAGTMPIGGICFADHAVAGESPRAAVLRMPSPGGEQHSFWIGAMCVPVDPALRSQLKLGEPEGLLVGNVMPGSPADKAGLKQYDVVTAIDGKRVESLHDLVAAVAAAGEKEIKLDVLRGGEKQTVGVTPAKRPDRDTPMFNPPDVPSLPPGVDPRPLTQHVERMREHLERMRATLPEGEVKRMEEWIERLQRGEQQPFRMQMFGPGVVMPRIELPPGTKIQIQRTDGKAKIHVEREGQAWDLAEDKLDELPEDLRGPVKAMLSQNGAISIQTTPGGAAAAATSSGDGEVRIEIKPEEAAGKGIVITPPGVDVDRMRQEVERLRKQAEELQKRVDELQKRGEKRTESKPPKKESSEGKPVKQI
ncbi:MAG: PDZ domain-containing protein [Planctomycetaceae bacterium]|nr:PDZ domain-containing protein [Planctomycetaceae bacterium]